MRVRLHKRDIQNNDTVLQKYKHEDSQKYHIKYHFSKMFRCDVNIIESNEKNLIDIYLQIVEGIN